MAIVARLKKDPSFHVSRATRILSEHESTSWKGRAPQLQTWINVWAEVTGGLSYNTQEVVSQKKGCLEASRKQCS